MSVGLGYNGKVKHKLTRWILFHEIKKKCLRLFQKAQFTQSLSFPEQSFRVLLVLCQGLRNIKQIRLYYLRRITVLRSTYLVRTIHDSLPIPLLDVTCGHIRVYFHEYLVGLGETNQFAEKMAGS